MISDIEKLKQKKEEYKIKINELVKKLDSRDKKTRRQALYDLANISWNSTAEPPADMAVPAIITVLQSDESTNTRALAAWTLGKIGSGAKPAIPALAYALVNDKSVDVREQSAWALDQIDPHTRDKTVLTALITALKQNQIEGPDICKNIVRALVNKGSAAVDYLIPLLNSVNMRVRIQAIEVLGEIGPDAKNAAAALARIMKQEEEGWYIRSKAAESLGKIGSYNKEAVSTIISILQPFLSDKKISYDEFSDKHIVPVAAVKALARIGHSDKSALYTLIKLANKKEYYDIRIAAIIGLGEMGFHAKAAKSLLINIIEKDSDEKVRHAAADAVNKISKK